ncbi:MAG: uracil-DNA glycosylase [Candidatus Heimdallarchaeaceae archaeon]
MTEKLEDLTKEIVQCEACNLRLGRTQVVPGIYGPKNGLCFIGEAPGYYEDQEGFPFVGRSGKLLDKMLEGIGLVREKDVSILNVIKCRPTTNEGNNRTPTETELRFCGERWLNKQLKFLSPLLLVAIGGIALKFFNPKISVTKIAGKMLDSENEYDVFVTYHPAYILRNYNLMEEYNNHFDRIKQIYEQKKKGDFSFKIDDNEMEVKKKGKQKSLTDYF